MITFLSDVWLGVVEIALAASVFVLAGFVVAGVLFWTLGRRLVKLSPKGVRPL